MKQESTYVADGLAEGDRVVRKVLQLSQEERVEDNNIIICQ